MTRLFPLAIAFLREELEFAERDHFSDGKDRFEPDLNPCEGCARAYEIRQEVERLEALEKVYER